MCTMMRRTIQRIYLFCSKQRYHYIRKYVHNQRNIHLTNILRNKITATTLSSTTQLVTRSPKINAEILNARSDRQSSIPPSPSLADELNFLLLLLQRMIMGLGIVHCITTYVVDITLCSGPSMLPTIQDANEIVLINRYAIRCNGKNVQDGTTINLRTQAALKRRRTQEQTMGASSLSNNVWSVIRMNNSSDTNEPQKFTWRDALKQLVSPLSIGDVVIVQNPNRPGTICKRILGLPGDKVIMLNGTIHIVPDCHVWVEGDNASNSLDSRHSGPMSMSLLTGRAVARIWPLRGNAWMHRTILPSQQQQQHVHYNRNVGNSIVIPAGYENNHYNGMIDSR